MQKRPSFSFHRSCGQYRGKLKDIILLYKYRKYRVLGKDLAQFIYWSMGRENSLWQGVEIIIPVPLHPKRKRQRGFNQAQVLAYHLAKRRGIELVKKVLVKTRNTPPQTLLEVDERQKSVKGAFDVSGKEKIAGKIVLLVDDVFTTGATIQECSRILKSVGAKEIRALTLAQA
ncbi:ComF family protein [Acidobacteriota bacterium]